MQKIIFTILLMCVSGISLFAQTGVTKEEYAVYAAILQNIYAENLKEYETESSFVILDKTFQTDNIIEDEFDDINGFAKDFNQKNKTSTKFEKLFPVDYRYYITEKSEINELLEIGEKELAKAKLGGIGISFGSSIVWKPFYEKYPNSNGYYQFSRIGFSSKGKSALVFMERDASSSDDSNWFILKKIKGKWEVYSIGGGGGIE